MTTRRLVFHFIGGLLAAVLLYGVLAGPDGLSRLACGVALASLAVSFLVARLLERRALERAARVFDYAMIGSLIVFVALSRALGGGALNGRIADGAYYLARGGHETRVTARTYYLLAGFETYLLSVVAAGIMFGIRSRTRENSERA